MFFFGLIIGKGRATHRWDDDDAHKVRGPFQDRWEMTRSLNFDAEGTMTPQLLIVAWPWAWTASAWFFCHYKRVL